MNSKFYQKIAIALLLVAVAMTVYGVWHILTILSSPEYLECRKTEEGCGVSIIEYVMFTIGAYAFAGLAFFHSGDLRKSEERNRSD